MLTLNNLRPPKGARRKTKRLGRGQGSGQGCQAGKGHKGQKSRSGGHVRTGFIGGAMPLYMRLPKRGFLNAPFKTNYAIVSLGQLEKSFSPLDKVTREALIAKGLLKGKNKTLPIKILSNGKLHKSLVFENIHKYSRKALESIKEAHGQVLSSKK